MTLVGAAAEKNTRNAMGNKMTKEEAIERLKRGHERFRQVISHLNDHQIAEEKALGDWTIKDIVAHLSVWNWEQTKAIDDLLADRKPWWWGLDEGNFNQEEIEKRKEWNLEKIIKEWEESFEKLIIRASRLSNEEWIYEACEKGEDGLLVNVDSMLSYEYRGEDHEAGHAKQIEEFLRQRKEIQKVSWGRNIFSSLKFTPSLRFLR